VQHAEVHSGAVVRHKEDPRAAERRHHIAAVRGLEHAGPRSGQGGRAQGVHRRGVRAVPAVGSGRHAGQGQGTAAGL